MRRILLSATAITAVLLTGGTFAQTGKNAGGGEGGQQLLPQQKGGGAGGGGGAIQGGGSTQGAAPVTGEPAGAGDQSGAAATQGEAAKEGASGQAGADAGAPASQGETKTESGAGQAKSSAPAKDEPQAGKADKATTKTKNVEITQEQRTTVRNKIVEQNVKPVTNINFEINVGIAVPQTIELNPLPPTIVEIVPAYSGYSFFLLPDGRVVIVDPSSFEIVYIL